MEIISFGTYAGEKIEWKIVHKEDGKALLFSKYGLDAKSYHDNKDENVSWENCSLRKWLNQDFYKSAFNQHEKDCIIEASVDKVFLLSLNDIEKYFGYNVHIRDRKYRHEDLVIVPTPYALSKGAYVVSQEAVRQYEKRSFIYPKWYQLNNDDIGSGWCWLKDCGDKPGTAALIDFGGVIAFWGDGVTETMGCVCPALWIDLNRYKNIVNKSGEANTSQKNIMKEQQIDPYDAPDLLSHRNDPNNMRLGFQSEGFYGGHAGTEIIYYAALRQVIVHKYSKSDKNGYKSSVDRIPIPENISSKKEMQTYVKICNSTCSDLITDDLGNSNHIILDGISYETSGPCGYIFRNQCQEVAEVDINLPYDSKIFFQGYGQYLRCEAFNSNMTLRPGNCIYMTDQDNNYYGTFEIPDFQHMYIHVNGKIISVVKDVKSWKFFLDGYMVASIFRLSEAAKIEYSSELSGKGDSERQLSVKIVKNLDAVWHPMILVTPILGF